LTAPTRPLQSGLASGRWGERGPAGNTSSRSAAPWSGCPSRRATPSSAGRGGGSRAGHRGLGPSDRSRASPTESGSDPLPIIQGPTIGLRDMGYNFSGTPPRNSPVRPRLREPDVGPGGLRAGRLRVPPRGATGPSGCVCVRRAGAPLGGRVPPPSAATLSVHGIQPTAVPVFMRARGRNCAGVCVPARPWNVLTSARLLVLVTPYRPPRLQINNHISIFFLAPMFSKLHGCM